MRKTYVVNRSGWAGTVRSGVVTAGALLLAAGVSSSLAAESSPKDLRIFFQKNCVQCHGADGSSRDAKGKSLSGQDFTDERWRKRSADAKLVKVILNGAFFGLAMPAFKNQLTQEESQRFVTEIIRKATQGKVIEPDSSGTEAQQP